MSATLGRSAPLLGLRARAAILWAISLLAGCGEPALPPRNLLLVMVDTLRADHLGHHGYARDTSPRLDALAADGVSFHAHYSHASRTGPSVASFFTGLHPRSHGVVNPLGQRDAKGTLHESQTTLAELLARQGFRSAGFVTNPNVSARFGFAQGFDTYALLPAGRGPDVNRVALKWLDSGAEPFLLYLHYMEPHSSYDAPPPHHARFVDRSYRGRADGSGAQLNRIVSESWVPAEADRAYLEALYDQEVRSFDDALGESLRELERRGLLDTTLVVVASDHGEEVLDHGSALHGYTLYEEQLRVPLVIRDPRYREGRRVEAITRHVDVAPTLLELLGIEPPEGLQGVSLAGWIRGDTKVSSAAPVFAEASLRAAKTVKLRSFMAEGWKLVQVLHPELREELYDLRADPGEQRDLAAARPAQRDQLRRQLEVFSRSLPIGEGGNVVLSDEEPEQLRSLGYLPPLPGH